MGVVETWVVVEMWAAVVLWMLVGCRWCYCILVVLWVVVMLLDLDSGNLEVWGLGSEAGVRDLGTLDLGSRIWNLGDGIWDRGSGI